MKVNCGSIAEKGRRAMKTFVDSLFFKAFAEETPAGGEGDEGGEGTKPSKSPTINYEDLIAKARKEEKEKQYKAIEKLKTQITTLTEQHNNDLLRIASLEQAEKEAKEQLTKAGKGDSEEVATLKTTIKTLEGEKTTLENELKTFKEQKPVSREEVEQEVRATLEAEYEVKTYKATQMAEHKDDILVPELVFGNTKEEIDASITSAIERSNEIKKNLGIGEKPQKRTPKSPTTPSVSGIQDSEVSLEKLATLDVRSPEYAKLRKQLGLR